MDDCAAELGRTPTDDEIAALLKKHGSPILAASRYQQEQPNVTFGRQLIGPVVFPFYWTAMKVTLVLLLIPGVIPAAVFGMRMHSQPLAQLGNALTRVARFSLLALLLVTLVFAAIDFGLRRFHLLEKWGSVWDPRTLPSPARQAKQVRRSSSIAGIIIQSIFIVWWWNHGSIPYLVVTNGGAQMHFAPVLTTLHLPILIVAFINLAQHWINLAEPDWRWLPSATGLVTSLICLTIFYLVLGTSPLISISRPNGLPISAREAAEIQKIVALGMISLWFGIMVVRSDLCLATGLDRLADAAAHTSRRDKERNGAYLIGWRLEAAALTKQNMRNSTARNADIFALKEPDSALWTLYIIRALLTGPGLVVLLPYLYFRYHTLRYTFDEEGIHMRVGILFRREVNLTYARIQDIHLSSGLLQRWLGLADIQVQTASGSADAELVIEGFKEYEAIRDFLYTRMRGYHAATTHAAETLPISAEAARTTADSNTEMLSLLRTIRDELRQTRELLEAGRGGSVRDSDSLGKTTAEDV